MKPGALRPYPEHLPRWSAPRWISRIRTDSRWVSGCPVASAPWCWPCVCVSLGSLSEAAQGEITPERDKWGRQWRLSVSVMGGWGWRCSGAAVVTALSGHVHAPGTKILAMVKMTDSEDPKVTHRGCVHAGVSWSVWTKSWSVCSHKTFIYILLNWCVSYFSLFLFSNWEPHRRVHNFPLIAVLHLHMSTPLWLSRVPQGHWSNDTASFWLADWSPNHGTQGNISLGASQSLGQESQVLISYCSQCPLLGRHNESSML